jgi:predicted DsbA family dithiol-disulfide isomerase
MKAGTSATRRSYGRLQTKPASTAEAHSLGINGIPAYVLDSRLLVLGAQPREVFEHAFAQLAE